MRFLRYILSYSFVVSISQAQSFQAFLTRVNSAPDSIRSAIVDSFMAIVPSFPIIERDTVVHFIYRGNTSSVTVPGDANAWDPNALPMARIGGTDFWYSSRVFEPDARLDYKFVLGGGTWILDPRNPNQVVGGFGPNSELKMSQYRDAPEIKYIPSIPHGTIRDTTFYSSALGNSRTIRIYTPPIYEFSSDSFGVILFHDGLEYISLAQANNVIDYLIWQNRIQPIIAVFVPPVNRTPEYAGNQIDQFSSFIVSELMPFIDGRYRTKRDSASRATLGASNGGNISLWLGYNYPHVFGNVAAQSSYIMPSLTSSYQNSPRLKLKLYLDLGTYDLPVLMPLVKNFIPILRSKGYAFQYQEYHEGHSWGNWRAHVDNALEFFFGAQPTKVREKQQKPEGYRLHQNYPNPFNPSTTIEYEVGLPSLVRLTVFDLLGRQVAMLVDGEKPAGSYQAGWQANVSTGTYFFRFEAVPSGNVNRRFAESKKMLVVK